LASPFEELADLDRLVHEPSRLAVLTALSACESADFVFLRRLTGLSDGNLSVHLTRLERAGLVAVKKGFAGKVPRSTVSLTTRGEAAIEAHWGRLKTLEKKAAAWRGRRREENPRRRGRRRLTPA
jgi:DNA-binding MarR family transcriptional regulator